MLFASSLLALPACECGSGTGDPDAAFPPGVDAGPLPDGSLPPDAPIPPSAVAVVEIHALDLWAQPLPSDATLRVTRDGAPVPTTGWPVATFPLLDAGTYEVSLRAEGYEDLGFAITFDGSSGLDATTLRRDAGTELAGLAHGHDVRPVGGRALPVHAFYAGLRHRWFSAQGRPARRGNRIRLMTSGEEAWAQVADDLLRATDRVHIATWWWDSTFELVRDPTTHVTSSLADREANSILGVLDDILPDKRVLVGQLVGQDGSLSWLTVDSDLRARGSAAGDGFEFMGQANETSGMFTWEWIPS
ncbi:MAG: hypothetical protein OHK0013_47930 [Sandaracinaceae bacterium]